MHVTTPPVAAPSWVHEKASDDIDEVHYKFTAKELDPETGLYYFGARYYDPRLGRWCSVDPPMVRGEYFPKATDFDTEHDYYWYLQQDASKKLPGIGGVFNAVNLDVYHYAGNNPVKLVDPDGNASIQYHWNGFREWMGWKVGDEPEMYVNQMYHVQSNRYRAGACGISSAAVITNMNVNTVDDIVRVANGGGSFLYRQNEANLVDYIASKGFEANKITTPGGDRKPTSADFAKMRKTIKEGGIILYHFAGHYAVMYGYKKTGEGENDYQYYFHDSAGNRPEGYFNDNGKNAKYSQDYLKSQDIRGDVWGFKEE